MNPRFYEVKHLEKKVVECLLESIDLMFHKQYIKIEVCRKMCLCFEFKGLENDDFI